jgi:hypothetical protein
MGGARESEVLMMRFMGPSKGLVVSGADTSMLGNF